MAYAYNYWQSTGFLNGPKPLLSPDSDPYMMSTFVAPEEGASHFVPLERGKLYAGYDVQAQGGASSYTPIFYDASLDSLTNYRKTACLANCTMGGCDDPTSDVHPKCVAAGCCGCSDKSQVYQFTPSATLRDANPSCVPLVDTPWYQAPLIPDQQVTTSNECFAPEQYCMSELAYKNCFPESPGGVADDVRCNGVRPAVIPW